MANLKSKTIDLDHQHRVVSFYFNDQKRPNAVLIYPISSIENGRITADCLSRIKSSDICLEHEQKALDYIEDDFILSLKYLFSQKTSFNDYLFNDLIENFKLKEQSYSSKRAYMVDGRRIAASCAIIYADRYKFSLTDSFNYFIQKLGKEPVQQRVVTRYIKRIKKELTVFEQKQYLVNLLEPNFPVQYLSGDDYADL